MLLALLILSGSSCTKKKTPIPAEKPYCTFTIKGVRSTFNSYNKFSKDLCVTSTYCGEFYYDSDNTGTNYIQFGIPGDPVVGHGYKSGEYRFDLFYLNDSGVRYSLTESPITVTFTTWEGQDGWAKGTFAGWLKSLSNDSIEIRDGYFQGKIWTIFR